mgnify:CR=1 FL=1
MRRSLALAALALPLSLLLAAQRPGGEPAPPAVPEMQTLSRAWEATGGRLEQAVLFLQEPVADRAVVERLAAGLGWQGPDPAGEERSLRLLEGVGGPYVEVTWRLTGEAALRWAERYRELRGSLADQGLWPQVQVELSGRAGDADPLALAEAALDAVGARQREPWRDARSASVAGYTPLLPPGPYAVNVQVAVRRSGDESRLWVGWPTVRSDY